MQELFELAQRKLLRQLTIYAENQDTDIYPRLFVADFLKEEVKDTTVNLTDDNLTTGTYIVQTGNIVPSFKLRTLLP